MLALFAGFLDLLRPATDAELIQRCLAGDRRAGRTLVHRLLPVIRARVRRCLGSATMGEIDDLVQEIWTGLLADDGRQLRGWDAAKGASLENYVGLIAKRKTLNALEHSRAQRRGGGQAAAELEAADHLTLPERPSGAIYRRDQLVRLADHLRTTLPERGWLIFRLHFTDGHEVPEVAQALNVTAQVVYNWVFRIRQEARAWLTAQEASATSARGDPATPVASPTPPR